MQTYTTPKGIKAWAEEDRPREKLLLKGKASLSNAELVAILIGSGNSTESAVELSKRILAGVSNNLNQLGRLTVGDLMKFKGIGEAKAIAIVAALEIGRRKQKEAALEKPQITCSKDIYDFIGPQLADLNHEEFWLITLNQANKIIGSERISVGGVSGTIADAKIVFKKAINALASSIAIAHNHPSGNLEPSEADIHLTKRFKEAGVFLDIYLIDHLIITNSSYYSFADNSLL